MNPLVVDKKSTCTVSNCDRPVLARGWCGTHYARWRDAGSVREDQPIRVMVPKSGTCSVEGCPRPRHTKGFCTTHYWRYYTKGDPGSAEIKNINKQRQECSVEECTKPTIGLGLCSMHYQRQLKGREIGNAQRQRRERGE